jgi:tetratricopeptide (TPR) repeat protein
MAQVFLSYDRDDADKARPIANALEKAGHSVWWDRHIGGGTEYSKEIEQALNSADIVVVLWTGSSIASPWVRDEAGAGRDKGRLVPLSLEGTVPPIGFRQFQSIDLGRWRGRGRIPRLPEILAAIDRQAKDPVVPVPTEPTPVKRRRAGPSANLWALIAVGIGMFFVIVGLLIGRPWERASSSAPTVAVSAVDDSPLSKDMARSLLVQLGRLQAAQGSTIQLVQQSSGRKPDFTFEIAGSTEGSKSVANVALTGRESIVLWSTNFERPVAQTGDLRQQIGLSAARVLSCADEALASDSKLDQQTLKLYLNGCATYADFIGTRVGDARSVIPIFSQVTKRAPEFKGAWAKLLLTEAEVATRSRVMERRSTEESLRRHLTIARKLDPEMPEVLYAEILLLPLTAVSHRMELIDKAVELHPDNATLRSLRSNLLLAVGRMHDAVTEAKQAAEIDILSPAMQSGYIFALAHSGQQELAQKELAKAEALWPGAQTLKDTRFSIGIRYGDPAAALKQLKTGAIRSDVPTAQESFLLARMSPTPGNVHRAISEAVAAERTSIRQLIQVLAEFGRVNDAIDYLLKYDATASQPFTDALFRPNTRNLRQDPRFMEVAKRFGLLDYWRTTGQWPDFCSEPGLPYDCKAEAAKLK